MKIALILFFLMLGPTNGAVKKNSRDDLAYYRSEVSQLGARLTSLEKEINQKNDLYLTSLEQIKQFEADVKLYQTRLNEIHAQVRKTQQENKHILQSYLLETDNESTEPWQRKVHLALLKQAQDRLKTKETELISFEKKVQDFKLKLALLKKNEEELAVVIKELEDRKQKTMEKYMASVQDKGKVEKIVQRKVLDKSLQNIHKKFSQAPIVESRADRIFARPVEDYLSYLSSPKGVTFKYDSIQPVKAVGQGKVVFAGDLSNYGQVVLIDHGQDLRTVLLGKMNIKVKKNDAVEDGDILAYTINDTKEEQTLYFEVRKKNTAQNTILWLDLDGVSKI